MSAIRPQPTRDTASKAAPSPRAQIVAGARVHFLAHGFRTVTMDELAAELGMSKKTLYTHFSSKIALVEAVVLDKLARADADLGRITAEAAVDFPVTLRQLLTCLQRHTEEITPSFVRDVRREAPEIFQVVEQKRQQMIQRHFGALVTRGQRLGMIRKDVLPAAIIDILLAATHAIVNPQRIEELGITPPIGYSAILTVVLEGALTAKGRSKP